MKYVNVKLLVFAAPWMVKNFALAEDACSVNQNFIEAPFSQIRPVGKLSRGQSFTADIDGDLRSVQLYFRYLTSDPIEWSVTGAVESETEEGDIPDESNILGSGTVEPPGDDFFPGFTIDMKKKDITMVAGEKYFLVLSCSGANCSPGSWYGYINDPIAENLAVLKDERVETPVWELERPTYDLSLRTIIGTGSRKRCAKNVASDAAASLAADPPTIGGLVISTDRADGDMTGGTVRKNEKRLINVANQFLKIANKVDQQKLERACILLKKLDPKLENWFNPNPDPGYVLTVLKGITGLLFVEMDC